MKTQLLIVSLLGFIACTSSLDPTREVKQGKIMGKTVHFENDMIGIAKDIDVFLGVPFAEPPVGDLRFAAPVPKQPWAEGEIYNATYLRDMCTQWESEYFTQSEDCLHLNIYAPNPMVSSFNNYIQ